MVVQRRNTSNMQGVQSRRSMNMRSIAFAFAAVLGTLLFASAQQQPDSNPFSNLATLEDEESLCQGTTPPRIVIDRSV